MIYFYSRPCGRGDPEPRKKENPSHISTHAPAGGATYVSAWLRTFSRISTHAPAGRATVLRINLPSSFYFYSRPCGRGDLPGRVSARQRPDFYSRPCGRGDFTGGYNTFQGFGFLLTPLREGRPSSALHRIADAMISTHAPAGGATDQVAAVSRGRDDFYSRPCGRGDVVHPCRFPAPSDFYSRPCGRGDSASRLTSSGPLISTHAPAGGATFIGIRVLAAQKAFLLTPLREGRRENLPDRSWRKSISTHAPAGGATGPDYAPRHHRTDFYSRPCGRGDLPLRGRPASHLRISTHAPAGGATKFYRDDRPYQRISTHAPAGGATKSTPARSSLCCAFLLTPLREGRPADGVKINGNVTVFLLTPLREGRQISTLAVGAKVRISTHAPAGGATDAYSTYTTSQAKFLLTPLREGRPSAPGKTAPLVQFLLTPLREGRPRSGH